MKERGWAMGETSPVSVPFNFLALPEEQGRLDRARVVVLPVPYDSTTSFRSGARDGPRAIIEASYNLEDYDPELDADVAEIGIYTAPWLEPHMEGPRHMIERVYDATRHFLEQGKLVALLGGEHSVSTGHVKALAEHYPDLSVLFLDAHADLRDGYMGTGWGHASTARRISEICPLVQVGVRSLTLEERKFIDGGHVKTFFWPPSHMSEAPFRPPDAWAWTGVSDHDIQPSLDDVIGLLSQNVYVSVDLDVFDPSIMSAVGTPEPGGMDWRQVTSLLRVVAERRHIAGFDVTELSPREGPTACAYTAAKLVYKLLAYACLLPGGSFDSRS
jgi:agmatinase